MKTLVLTFFIALSQLAMAQDSTEIKLKQYKEMHSKGLITDAEYQALKGKTLNLTPATTPTAEKKTPYYERKAIFNARLVPVGYFDVHGTSGYSFNGHTTTIKPGLNRYGGIHFQIGPSFKKMFAPNLAVGVEFSPTQTMLPVYADFNINFIKKKVSPMLHTGLGYINVKTKFLDAQHGALAMLGLGVNANLGTHFSLTVAADYRFLYYSRSFEVTDEQGQRLDNAVWKTYVQQVGVRAYLTFY